MMKTELTMLLLKPVSGSGRMLLDLWSENGRSGRLPNKKSFDIATSSVITQPDNALSSIDGTGAMTFGQHIRELSSQL